MLELNGIGKSLIVFGLLLIAIGVIFLFGCKIGWFGRLPGDILIEKKNFTFYFPVATSILLSIIIWVILYFLGRR